MPQMVKHLPAEQETGLIPGRKDALERRGYPPHCLFLLCWVFTAALAFLALQKTGFSLQCPLLWSAGSRYTGLSSRSSWALEHGSSWL